MIKCDKNPAVLPAGFSRFYQKYLRKFKMEAL